MLYFILQIDVVRAILALVLVASLMIFCFAGIGYLASLDDDWDFIRPAVLRQIKRIIGVSLLVFAVTAFLLGLMPSTESLREIYYREQYNRKVVTVQDFHDSQKKETTKNEPKNETHEN
jgi:multisubunit Na+/H+ antiporter MnhC subunit